MSRRSLTVGLASGLLLFAHACTMREITVVQVGSIEVQPSSVALLEGETTRLTAQVKDEFGQSLPAGTVTWSSDAPSIFSIDSTGVGEALASGNATVWATLSGTRGSGHVSVQPGPSIAVSEASLLFAGTVGGTAPDPATLEITNGGGGSVGGISASVQYPEGGAVGWLSLALGGTSAPTTLIVTSLLAVLEEGTHEATLVLASRDDGISPVTVPVQAVVVLDKPILGLSSRALAFQAKGSGALPAPETVRVVNQGGGVLADLQATSLYAGVGGWLSASLTGTTAPAELLVRPDPSGLSPGTYTAEVRVSGPGALNTPLPVDVTFTLEAGAVSPAHATATLPNGRAGTPTHVVVQARDGSGYALSSGGATVTVTVSGANAAGPVTATDVGDGTYTASYLPTAAGIDQVAITMDGTSIGGSPFTRTVVAGSANPANATATVPSGSVGSATDVLVRARDAYGNPVTSGGATVVVTVSGANAAGPITAAGAGDGTYTASYTPTSAGTDQVAITMNGTPVSGSPFTSAVAAGSPSPTHSTATVRDGTAGLPTNIVVQARDESGKPFNFGGATVVVTVSGANKAGALTVTDRSDGTYTASYTPTSAGTDQVAITMNGTPVSGSPFTSAVAAGSPSPAHSTATVPSGKAKRPTTIVVQARDAYGNALSGGGATVVVTVSGKNRAGPMTATDVGDGTYTATYTPRDKGTDSVAITMNGTPIEGSPFTSKVSR